jgi:hypothetical protein
MATDLEDNDYDSPWKEAYSGPPLSRPFSPKIKEK